MNCECGNIAERNGKCASCNRLERKAQKPKPKKEAAKLPKFSDKMEKALKVYAVERRLFLEKNPACKVCGKSATDIHHSAGKSSIELLLDYNLWIQVCRACHTLIELNPVWAKQNRYSISRLSKKAQTE